MASIASKDAAGHRRPPLPPRWRRLSLAGQFALAGSVVLLAGMVAIGIWVTAQIADGVLHAATHGSTGTLWLCMAGQDPLAYEFAPVEVLGIPADVEG